MGISTIGDNIIGHPDSHCYLDYLTLCDKILVRSKIMETQVYFVCMRCGTKYNELFHFDDEDITCECVYCGCPDFDITSNQEK